mmetsp:Transcript_19973/g.56123  ORF Transcript_19973/g.56123 Transcript_19973/m.56123 type:complete len:324 (-) Transcript_19973:17-988(-)
MVLHRSNPNMLVYVEMSLLGSQRGGPSHNGKGKGFRQGVGTTKGSDVKHTALDVGYVHVDLVETVVGIVDEVRVGSEVGKIGETDKQPDIPGRALLSKGHDRGVGILHLQGEVCKRVGAHHLVEARRAVAQGLRGNVTPNAAPPVIAYALSAPLRTVAVLLVGAPTDYAHVDGEAVRALRPPVDANVPRAVTWVGDDDCVLLREGQVHIIVVEPRGLVVLLDEYVAVHIFVLLGNRDDEGVLRNDAGVVVVPGGPRHEAGHHVLQGKRIVGPVAVLARVPRLAPAGAILAAAVARALAGAPAVLVIGQRQPDAEGALRKAVHP